VAEALNQTSFGGGEQQQGVDRSVAGKISSSSLRRRISNML
jgi:hypothetical protein